MMPALPQAFWACPRKPPVRGTTLRRNAEVAKLGPEGYSKESPGDLEMKSGIVALVAALATGGAVMTSSAQTQLQPFSGQAPAEASVQLPAASENSQALQDPGQAAGAGNSSLVANIGEAGLVSPGAQTEVKSKIK